MADNRGKQNGLPELLIENMAVTGSSLVVSTRSGNLYVSHDGGRNWARTAANVDSEDFAALHVLTAGSGETVVAASATEGLFVVELGSSRPSAAIDRSESATQLAPDFASVPRR